MHYINLKNVCLILFLWIPLSLRYSIFFSIIYNILFKETISTKIFLKLEL